MVCWVVLVCGHLYFGHMFGLPVSFVLMNFCVGVWVRYGFVWVCILRVLCSLFGVCDFVSLAMGCWVDCWVAYVCRLCIQFPGRFYLDWLIIDVGLLLVVGGLTPYMLG